MSKKDPFSLTVLTVAFSLALTVSSLAQTNAHALVLQMVTNENLAEQHRGRFVYFSKERSERTGNHLWTERVAETSSGKLRLLIAEDDQPLSPDRNTTERARLNEIAAHPDAFAHREQALTNDEHHAKEMLDLLPRAFLFNSPTTEGPFTRITFHPDPAYQPQSLEERVLHAMTGSLLIDPATRLHSIEGRLPEDVAIGFGILATIKAGSNFSTTRERVFGNEWKTATLDTNINGRAIFFKTIGKQQHAEHSEFKPLSNAISVAGAVTLLLAP